MMLSQAHYLRTMIRPVLEWTASIVAYLRADNAQGWSERARLINRKTTRLATTRSQYTPVQSKFPARCVMGDQRSVDAW